jgi:hypothetical protein
MTSPYSNLSVVEPALSDPLKADKIIVEDEYDDPIGYVATFDETGNLDVSVVRVAEIVTSETIFYIVKCTQAEYDLLSPPDENTLYVIVEEDEY